MSKVALHIIFQFWNLDSTLSPLDFIFWLDLEYTLKLYSGFEGGSYAGFDRGWKGKEFDGTPGLGRSDASGSSPCSGGLAHRETGRFPGGPLLQEFFRAPGHTCEFISLIIRWHSRQTGSAFTEPVERPPYLPVWSLTCSGASCYVCEKFSGRVQMYDGCCSVKWRVKKVARKLRANCCSSCHSWVSFRLAPALIEQ